MNRPRIATIVSSALASALAFFIITKSGLAGTLGGAAVASIVATSMSHWTGVGLEHGSLWFRRRVVNVRTASNEEETAAPEEPAPEAATVSVAPAEALSDETTLVAPVPTEGTDALSRPLVVPGRRTSPTVWRRRLVTWGPFVLGMLALGVSAYSLGTGTPLERVIVRERVVEKPKVVEHVVVEKQTVRITVPTQTSQAPSQPPAVSTSPAADSTSSATTTTAPRATTTTSAPRVTTTTAPRATATTAPRPVTTTAPPTTAPPPTAPGGLTP